MMHDRPDMIDAFPRVLRFPIPDPPVQPLDLRADHRLRRRAYGITRGQPVRDLFAMLKFHRYVKPIKNRRFQDARAGENAAESGTTIGESRQHSVLDSTNRIEVLPDQPFDVCLGFRDAAENLTTTSLCFDIANP